jgi:hypothetical protein
LDRLADRGAEELLTQAAQHFKVENQSPTTVYDLQLNTLTPPFNNPKGPAGHLRGD